jgi:hypothetical protein
MDEHTQEKYKSRKAEYRFEFLIERNYQLPLMEFVTM